MCVQLRISMGRSRIICSVILALVGLSLASEMEKRLPSGFQGMRGKKSIDDAYPDNSLLGPGDALDKRVPSSGFVGMRGKKLFPERLVASSDLFKRAPMGFMGMRGKKDMEIMNLGEEFEKRAPMGFLGVRGKKESDEDMIADQSFYTDKRAPMGFMGMRGKKEYNTLFDEDKRAPANSFFGMRGKKQPARSSFFGMRGKKYPYEFRGKFVGVRGKKMSDDTYLHENELDALDADAVQNNMDLDELMMYLTKNENEKRKDPIGFFGMRG